MKICSVVDDLKEHAASPSALKTDGGNTFPEMSYEIISDISINMG
jgi:hypothetical protein